LNQREVGIDTDSYADALRNTLRQAPDVILIGEINSQETMQHAITFSETGHLCLSTLHANNAHQALERIINFFPIEHRERLLLDLSLNLRAIISQRLVPSVQGRRVAAFEILLTTPLVKDYLLRGAISEIDEVIGRSEDVGMQSFDEALYKLFSTGKISEDNALQYANSRNNLRLRINLENKNPH
jgi:twitching motility protein PilU